MMRIRVTTRADLYEKRKQEHIERGYRIAEEWPIPVNGFCPLLRLGSEQRPTNFQSLRLSTGVTAHGMVSECSTETI